MKANEYQQREPYHWFMHASEYRIITSIKNSVLPFREEELQENISNQQVLDLLHKCWNASPEDRPTISHVVARLRAIGGYDNLADPRLELSGLLTPPDTPPQELDEISLRTSSVTAAS
jgi:hypothetical protein